MAGARYRIAVLAALTLVALAATPAAAQLAPGPPPNISCGGTITHSLVANTDLSCPGDGLTIGADNVTLDLGGHTVSGPGIGRGIVISGRQHVRVTDGAVTGYNQAVQIIFSQDVSISSLTADSGIYIGRYTGDGSARIAMSRIHLTGSLAVGTGVTSVALTESSVTGGSISFARSVAPRLADNTLTDTYVQLEQTEQAQFVRNRLTRGNLLYHRSADGGVVGNLLQDAPVSISFSPGTVVEDNVLVNRGLYALDQDRLTIRNNLVSGDPSAGVQLDYDSPPTGVQVVGNVLAGNGSRPAMDVDRDGVPIDDGLHVTAPAGSGILVADNHTFDNADHGIEAQPGTVRDGGGNTSYGDPAGCLGVVCG